MNTSQSFICSGLIPISSVQAKLSLILERLKVMQQKGTKTQNLFFEKGEPVDLDEAIRTVTELIDHGEQLFYFKDLRQMAKFFADSHQSKV